MTTPSTFQLGTAGERYARIDSWGHLEIVTLSPGTSGNVNDLRIQGNTTNTAAAAGTHAIAAGRNTTASGAQGVAIGGSATASQGATVSAQGGIAIGGSNTAGNAGASVTAANAIAIGSGSAASAGPAATAVDSISIGRASNTSQSCAIAIGLNAVGNGADGISIGRTSANSNTGGIAIGLAAECTGDYGIAGGNTAEVSIQNGIAFGNGAIATSTPDPAFPALSGGDIALGWGAVSEWIPNVDAGAFSYEFGNFAAGKAAKANGSGNVCIGNNAEVGYNAASGGVPADYLVTDSICIGTDSYISFGFSSIVIGDNSSCWTTNCVVIGPSSDITEQPNVSDIQSCYVIGVNNTITSTVEVAGITPAANRSGILGNDCTVSLGDAANSFDNSTVLGSTNTLTISGAGTVDNCLIAGSLVQATVTTGSLSNCVILAHNRTGWAVNATDLSNSVCIGNQTVIGSTRTVAIGAAASASGATACAIGANARSSGAAAFAAGGSATANEGATSQGAASVAIGGSASAGFAGANASGASSIAIGPATVAAAGATANNDLSIAIGVASASTANYAAAIGYGCTNGVADSVALGSSSGTTVPFVRFMQPATASQGVSNTTAVTCDGSHGVITMFAGIAGNTGHTFTWNNSQLSANSVVLLQVHRSPAGADVENVTISSTAGPGIGSMGIRVFNPNATATDDPVRIHFFVMNSAT